MTIHLADPERTSRRAPAVAEQLDRHPGTPRALEVAIERRPDPERISLSAADAAWPQRLRRLARASLKLWGRPDLIEVVELLLSELGTNALQHSNHDIGVRLYFAGGRCVIAVHDGSTTPPLPRTATATDESGRGLALVDALADAWGISPDGTTTWCSLSLRNGTAEMEPAAAAPLVSRQTRLQLPPDPSALKMARINGRTKLTMLNWQGNQHGAVNVLYVLVNNALRHGLPPGATQGLEVWLRITEAHDLIIDVTDPDPTFPDFDQAVAGHLGQGLWGARQLGASITWFPEVRGKTVRATMRPPVQP
ncbi:ATP-binding protein (plasmid) [Streptomyces sp. NBC_01220]|uniref:ATP-binding protein n=1 Tax=Streptomyces sp. NBC_01220 TaxID=2903781 RepID=UPI00352E3537|nr:ATP-binding protein [Streptomyces sp. NBC_01220]